MWSFDSKRPKRIAGTWRTKDSYLVENERENSQIENNDICLLFYFLFIYVWMLRGLLGQTVVFLGFD
jgi:hypothetical protein